MSHVMVAQPDGTKILHSFGSPSCAGAANRYIPLV
jgi:hypothetical protein